jgi:hypothetical protein
MADEFRAIRELREKFMRAVYELRHPSTGMAPMDQIGARMGLDPENNMRDKDLYVEIAQYFHELGYIRRVLDGYGIVAITATGIQYVEGDLQQQAGGNVTFNIGTAERSIIGTQNHAQLEANINFDELAIEIEERGGEDKEVLWAALMRIAELIEERDSIDRGELAEFSEVMERHSWFTGAVAQALLGFATQALSGGLAG